MKFKLVEILIAQLRGTSRAPKQPRDQSPAEVLTMRELGGVYEYLLEEVMVLVESNLTD